MAAQTVPEYCQIAALQEIPENEEFWNQKAGDTKNRSPAKNPDTLSETLSLIQTYNNRCLLSVPESHRFSHKMWVADSTAGWDLHPTPKNFLFTCYKRDYNALLQKLQLFFGIDSTHRQLDALFLQIYAHDFYFYHIANADCF